VADKDQKDLDEMQQQALEQLTWLNDVAGLDIAEIARRLDVARSTVSRWKHGHRGLTRRSCKDIAQLYQEMQQKEDRSDITD